MTDFLSRFKLFSARKFPFKFIYSDSYWMVDLHDHIFPIRKYRLLYENLLRLGAKKDDFVAPAIPSDKSILRVHSSRYLKKIRSGKLTQSELQILEIPFSHDGLEFAFLNVGGTIQAAELALKESMAFHIGGGFHHAFSDHGEGFCVFNDVAVAVEEMKYRGKIEKVMVVDCDVHQGNGTAAIFEHKEYVFTFSIHQMDLYPAVKPPSSLDVELWSGEGDQVYLEALRGHIPGIFHEFRPDLIFYLAGADPYRNDQLGGLALSLEGLRERDQIILGHACKLGIPVAVVLGGGYALDIQDTVSIHLNTVHAARRAFRSKKSE